MTEEVTVRRAFDNFMGYGYEVLEDGKKIRFVRCMTRMGATWLYKRVTLSEAKRVYKQLKERRAI